MTHHYPTADRWERREPEAVGVDADRLAAAVAFAESTESPVERDFSEREERYAIEGEYAEPIGPIQRRRGDQSGLVVKDGFVVADWGDPGSVEMAFSVTKSYLSAVAGLAYDRGLIEDVEDRVGASVRDGGFDYSHNDLVTWEQFLHGTSEWEGTLFGKPDRADRRRGRDRELEAPGTFWEYNDVRINRLSLSLLRVVRRPLPRLLEDGVMDPTGASDTWRWHGYDNADVFVEGRTAGQTIRCVSGGGHWGGGLWTDSLDLARFGYLYLRRGEWDGRQLLSEEWVDKSTTPCELKPTYGYLWWLNTDRELWPDAPETSFAALGYGRNAVWVDPEHDLVVVLRWFGEGGDGDKRETGTGEHPVQNEFFRRLLAAVE